MGKIGTGQHAEPHDADNDAGEEHGQLAAVVVWTAKGVEVGSHHIGGFAQRQHNDHPYDDGQYDGRYLEDGSLGGARNAKLLFLFHRKAEF